MIERKTMLYGCRHKTDDIYKNISEDVENRFAN